MTIERIRTLIHGLLSKATRENIGPDVYVHLTLGNAPEPDLLLFGNDHAVMQDIAAHIQKSSKDQIKPAVYESKTAFLSNENFHIMIPHYVLRELGEHFDFRTDKLIQELQSNSAQLTGKGHTEDNRVKLQIAEPSKAHSVTPQEFKTYYDKHAVLKNSGSPMYKALKQQELKNIEEIRKYAIEHPDSRTAEVYDSLRYG